MKSNLAKLKNLADKALANLKVNLYYVGFDSLEDFIDYVHKLESIESFHSIDDVLNQLQYYTKLQRKILQELERLK